MTSALVGSGIEDVRVSGIECDVADSSVVTDEERQLPALPTIFCFVETAFSALSPQGPLCSNINHVGVSGIYYDLADVFRLLKAHVFPAGTSISALVDAISVPHTSLTIVLPSSQPQGFRVHPVHSDTANGIRAIVVKDWCPGCAIINGLPDVS
jgi:hypothetical protein